MTNHYSAEEVLEARAMLACPYFNGAGICSTGCFDEPLCQSCEPLEGWLAIASTEPTLGHDTASWLTWRGDTIYLFEYQWELDRGMTKSLVHDGVAYDIQWS